MAVVALVAAACGAEEATETAQDSPQAFGGYLTETGLTFRTMEPWLGMTATLPEAVRDEMTAMHYATAVVAVSKAAWSQERKRAELADAKQRLAAAMAPGSGRTEASWVAYIEERAPAFVDAVPAEYDPFVILSNDELRRMGSTLVEGVRSHPMAPEEPLYPDEDWALSAGRYLRGRVFQMMRALEDMP